MGISGLLSNIKDAIERKHISTFANKRAAVDSYCWLHRSLTCAMDPITGQLNRDKWIEYVMRFVDMLLHFGITVYMVFDGAELPAKQGTEIDRKKRRQSFREQGLEFARKGDDLNAKKFMTQAHDVDPKMAAELIRELALKRPTVHCVVAPYEADAQLAALSLDGHVDFIISEDSDTIPYGCSEVLFKLGHDGYGDHLILANLYSCGKLGDFDLRKFSPEMMLVMCVASGCDYLDSVKNFGIKSAHSLSSKFSENTAERLLKNMRWRGMLPSTPATHLLPGDFKTPAGHGVLEYELLFYLALTTFKHQMIYDITTGKARPLTPIKFEHLPACVQAYSKNGRCPASSSSSSSSSSLSSDSASLEGCAESEQYNFDFLGPPIDDLIAQGIAKGLVDPTTKLPFTFDTPVSAVADKQKWANQTQGFKASVAKQRNEVSGRTDEKQKSMLSFLRKAPDIDKRSGPDSGKSCVPKALSSSGEFHSRTDPKVNDAPQRANAPASGKGLVSKTSSYFMPKPTRSASVGFTGGLA
jgi:exonuclease 1